LSVPPRQSQVLITMYFLSRSDITIVCRAMEFGQLPPDSHKCYSQCIYCLGVPHHCLQSYGVWSVPSGQSQVLLTMYLLSRSDITIVCSAMEFGQFPLDSHKCYSQCIFCLGVTSPLSAGLWSLVSSLRTVTSATLNVSLV